MTLTILDDSMSSDRSPHTARLAPGQQHTWEVSWLPGRHLDCNKAITAMVLADETAEGAVHPGHRFWPHIEGWAAELGVTADQAVTQIACLPAWAPTAETAAGPPDPEAGG